MAGAIGMTIQTRIGILLLAFPVVIYLLIAWAEKYRGGKRRKIPRPRDRVASPIHDFHRAEFTALRTEVAELVKSNTTNFQYALLASGGIFAWIASAKLEPKFYPINEDWEQLVWLLPLFVAS